MIGGLQSSDRVEREASHSAEIDRGGDSIRRLLVANRSEIAIRIFRAATELRIRTCGRP